MKNFDIQEKVNENLADGVKGLFYGSFYIFKATIKTYTMMLLYLVLWPMFLMNWIVNGSKKRL